MEVTKREEEYLETMYILHKNKGVIRVKDIAKALNVRPPSVVDALKKLAEKGLIEYEKYDRILLTEKGRKLPKTRIPSTYSLRSSSRTYSAYHRRSQSRTRASSSTT